MKRKFIAGLAILSLFSLTSCQALLDTIRGQIDDGINGNLPVLPEPDGTEDLEITDVVVPTPDEAGKYKIIYDFNNGFIKESTCTKNNLVLEPEAPKKLCSTFLYWCSDEELNHKFDFTRSIHKDTIIYAKYEIDFMELTNKVSATAILSNVRILGKFSNGGMFETINTSLGSGVIIDEDSNYYYALTNHHVVYKPANMKNAEYYAVDAYQNRYTISPRDIYKDVNYDLALVKIKKNNDARQKLPVIKMAKEIVNMNDLSQNYLPKNEVVIAMGEPLAQSNTITYGRILDSNAYYKPEDSFVNESNVNFRVINHTAPINSGSSGGALLDSNLHLIGINFASSTITDTNNNKYSFSCTIPLNRVLEFLNNLKN